LLAVSNSIVLEGQWTGGGERIRCACSSETDCGEKEELLGEREEIVGWRGEPGSGDEGSSPKSGSSRPSQDDR
jgi:hypothetical protein